MKIVSLDAYLVNPGDLDWGRLPELGEFVHYDETRKEEQIERLKDANAVLINRSRLVEGIWDACPHLKYVGLLSTGYNHIDLEDCRRNGVAVTNVPRYGDRSVAQFALGLMFELANRTGFRIEDVKNGRTGKDGRFDEVWRDWVEPMLELPGRTLGIVGMGSIGIELAKMAKGIGMTVLGYSRSECEAGRAVAEYANLETVLRSSDVVSLHLPLTPSTYHIIDDEALALMRPGAILINTSRGGLVDEAALKRALERGHLAGCGLDVVSNEPVGPNHPLLQYPNVRITPHIAWGYQGARRRMLECATRNLESWLEGGDLNRIV